MPLSVAVALVRHADRLLLIRRTRGSYAGWWALPGGKIEDDEHVSEAVLREVREETGLRATFDAHLGVVSEHLVEDGRARKHFLLHLCALSAGSHAVTAGPEGALRWIAPDAAGALDRLVPSDRAILRRVREEEPFGYRECVMEKRGATYRLRSFG